MIWLIRSCYCLYFFLCFIFFFKQKTAYEMRISDWSSDVCSSDLVYGGGYLLNTLKSVFSALQVKSRGDQHRYLALVHDYGRLVSQMEDRKSTRLNSSH